MPSQVRSGRSWLRPAEPAATALRMTRLPLTAGPPSYPFAIPGGAQCVHINLHVLQPTVLIVTRPTPSLSTPGKGGACCATASSSSTTRANSCPMVGQFLHADRSTSNCPSPPERPGMPECAPLGWLVTRDWFNREEFADVYAISMLFTSAHSLMYEKGRDVAMSRTRARMSFMTRLELERPRPITSPPKRSPAPPSTRRPLQRRRLISASHSMRTERPCLACRPHRRASAGYYET